MLRTSFAVLALAALSAARGEPPKAPADPKAQ